MRHPRRMLLPEPGFTRVAILDARSRGRKRVTVCWSYSRPSVLQPPNAALCARYTCFSIVMAAFNPPFDLPSVYCQAGPWRHADIRAARPLWRRCGYCGEEFSVTEASTQLTAPPALVPAAQPSSPVFSRPVSLRLSPSERVRFHPSGLDVTEVADNSTQTATTQNCYGDEHPRTQPDVIDGSNNSWTSASRSEPPQP